MTTTKFKFAWIERFPNFYAVNFVLENIPKHAHIWYAEFDVYSEGTGLTSGQVDSAFKFFTTDPETLFRARSIIVDILDENYYSIERVTYPNCLPMISDGQYYDRSENRIRFLDKPFRGMPA